MPGNKEIERKFLVSAPPKLPRSRGVQILQGYFPMRGNALEIRLRRKGSDHFITFKTGAGAQRGEFELPISKTIFASLWPCTTDGHIAKRRYKIPFQNLCIEMDVYEGPHRGLITADVEFSSVKQCRAFQPPDWFGRELTSQKNYSNHALACRGKLPGKPKRK